MLSINRYRTIRKISKPSTAQCQLEHYTLFLLSEPKHGGCSRLAEILGDVSHDSINRFLLRERYSPQDLFNIVKSIINLQDRTVSNEAGKYSQVSNLAIPESGLITHLQEFGFIKLFRKDFKKGDSRHYVFYVPNDDALKQINRSEFVTIHDTHWGIESFHRAIKQVCGICRFMVRDSHAIKTHIFCSLQAFVRLEKMRSEKLISNWYELQRNLFTKVIREYVLNNLGSTGIA
jgi:hypothetical protein